MNKIVNVTVRHPKWFDLVKAWKINSSWTEKDASTAADPRVVGSYECDTVISKTNSDLGYAVKSISRRL